VSLGVAQAAAAQYADSGSTWGCTRLWPNLVQRRAQKGPPTPHQSVTNTECAYGTACAMSVAKRRWQRPAGCDARQKRKPQRRATGCGGARTACAKTRSYNTVGGHSNELTALRKRQQQRHLSCGTIVVVWAHNPRAEAKRARVSVMRCRWLGDATPPSTTR
jgi:hypothetical protein